MHPILFEFSGLPVYSYGVLLAAAYLLGLRLALVRARRRGLDPNRVMDLGIYIIISALVGAKLLLLVVEFDTSRATRRELLSLVRSGGVFYGGLHRRRRRGALVLCDATGCRIWTITDVFAPGIALGPRDRPPGLLVRRLLLRPSDERSVGDHVHATRSPRQNVGTPLGRAAAPDPAVRGRRRALHPRPPALDRTPGPPVPGRTFWLYMLLYGVSRFVIEFYRGDDRGG